MNRRKGASLVELGAGALVLIPIFLYAIDYASLFWAQQFNANICRDAARAAASGPPTMFLPNGPSDQHRPRMRARAVINKSSNPTGMMRVEPTFKFWEKIETPVPQAPYGGPVKGWVRVRSTVTLNPPFKLPTADKVVALEEEETFPFTWVMPTNYTGQFGGTPAWGTTPAIVVDSDP